MNDLRDEVAALIERRIDWTGPVKENSIEVADAVIALVRANDAGEVERSVWLIERDGAQPTYWTGGTADISQEHAWTASAYHGVAFSDPNSAVAALAALISFDKPCGLMRKHRIDTIHAREHIFIDAAIAQQAQEPSHE